MPVSLINEIQRFHCVEDLVGNLGDLAPFRARFLPQHLEGGMAFELEPLHQDADRHPRLLLDRQGSVQAILRRFEIGDLARACQGRLVGGLERCA